MFDYVQDLHKVKIRIGQYVAHYVVQEKPFSKIVRSIEQINAMNRYDLAKAFLESREAKYFYRDVGEYDPERLLDDVARYIDQRIPKAYITWESEQEADFNWSAKAKGLIYQFPEHADIEEKIKIEAEAWRKETPATERQIRYLRSLLKNSGYFLDQIEELNVDEASQYISFIVEDAPLPDELFKRLEYDI